MIGAGSNMGMVGNVMRVSLKQLNDFLNDSQILESKIDSDESFNAKWLLDLDKSWDGIQYILTGKGIGRLSTEPDALGRALFGSQIIDEEQDLGYGPAHYLTPEQVKETYSKLEKITDEEFAFRYSTTRMKEMEVYPQIWTESESFVYLQDYFIEFREFYRKAGEENEAIVTYLN